MFQKYSTTFKRLTKNITSFLSEYRTMSPGPLYADYEGAYKRYKELVSDPVLIDQLKELRMLETIILQVQSIHNLEPILFHGKPQRHNYLYARAPFAKRHDVQNEMRRSLGDASRYPKTARKAQEDPQIMALAKDILLEAMMDEYIIEEYNLKYPKNKWPKKPYQPSEM